MNNMEPIQITLGEGKVAITNFHDSDGRGIIFQDTGEPHEVGSYGDDLTGEHIPQPGEIFIKCTNKESALVLLERVERIIEGFDGVGDVRRVEQGEME